LTAEDLFRITVEPHELIRVFINNIPPVGETHIHGMSDNTFHFRMYYDTFSVKANHRYDFTVPSAGATPPHHDAPSGTPADGEHHLEEAANSMPPSEIQPDDAKPSCAGGRGIPGMICGLTHMSKFSKSLG
ncbi:MAG TPA: hypothetical protein VN743_05220, partial [Blastocatellia bacterium]|nr:hypothetical protein [Blastocatellia bacterium]